MTLDSDNLKRFIQEILTTRSDEIACTTCFEQLDRFAEMILAGQDAAEVMPMVQDHLEHCPECREEFEALLKAIRDSEQPG
jgi:hypothetical protein